MDTSSFKPEELASLQELNQAKSGIEDSGGFVTGESSFVHPLKRALRGFISFLSGDVDQDIESEGQTYFEKFSCGSSNGSIHGSSNTERAGGYNRFNRAIRRLRTFSQYNPAKSVEAPCGKFGGRHVIGENTAINGGVYLGAFPQEAIVVDDRHGALERLYNQLVVKLAEVSIDRKLEESEILPELASLVVQNLCFDERQVREITEREKILPDDKVAIDMYLYEHVGVARHQVLVAAYLIERLKKRGVLSGHMSIDSMSNHIKGQDERLVYTSPHGYLFIFDPLKLKQVSN